MANSPVIRPRTTRSRDTFRQHWKRAARHPNGSRPTGRISTGGEPRRWVRRPRPRHLATGRTPIGRRPHRVPELVRPPRMPSPRHWMRSPSGSETASSQSPDPLERLTRRQSLPRSQRCWESANSLTMPNVHLEVRGRVQGVGFRWFVVETANELKLAGWVRNTANGNVEIAASGPAEELARFENAVNSGPRAARVESVR